MPQPKMKHVKFSVSGERWTAAEEEFLRDNFLRMSAVNIAIKLQRTPDAVRQKARIKGWHGKKIKSTPPALLASQVKAGVIVRHLSSRNLYRIEGSCRPYGDKGEWRFHALRIHCDSNPRAPQLRQWLLPANVALLVEYERWETERYGKKSTPQAA